MLRICTRGNVTALGELGIPVLSLKVAVRAVSEAAVGATLCEWLRRAHAHWGTKAIELGFKVYMRFPGTVYEIYKIFFKLHLYDILR